MCVVYQDNANSHHAVRVQSDVNNIKLDELLKRGLEYAQALGLTNEQYQDCFESWEDAVIGCGKTPSLELLPQLKKSIDDYLEYDI